MASVIETFIAGNRFGFGFRPGEAAEAARDPRGWLTAQLNSRHAHNPELAGLPSTNDALKDARDLVQRARQLKKSDSAEGMAEAKGMLKELRQDYICDIGARVRAAVQSPAPFFERLVHFWSNHFTVSTQKRQSLPLAAAFERDAIRPHIMGNFYDLLLAATKHPAMLLYLDNARSAGPQSRAGQRRGLGLNENLAREIMELHTLGVNGGYGQADVISFAKILTGWSVDARGLGDGSGFYFMPPLHEPGAKTLLGKTYAAAGEGEAMQVLGDLAHHPATANFLATKLVRHFTADDPAPADVAAIARVYQQSGGDLPAVYRALIDLPSVWQTPLPKVKTPNDFVLSALRVSGTDLEDKRVALSFRTLGQMPFSAASPQGWSDQARDWVGAEALLQRIDFSRALARKLAPMTQPMDFMQQTIGPIASPETAFAVKTAGSPAEALTLLFASPEFQRR